LRKDLKEDQSRAERVRFHDIYAQPTRNYYELLPNQKQKMSHNNDSAIPLPT